MSPLTFKRSALAAALMAVVVVATCTACGGGGGGDGGTAIPGVVLGPVPGGVIQPPATAGCTIVLYGDSILRGEQPGGIAGIRRLDNPPETELHHLLPAATIEDRSRTGQTAAAAAVTFPVEPRTARVVVIEHGTNDMMLGLPLEQPLRAMVDYAKAEGRVVVLTGMSQQSNSPRWAEYAEVPRKVAKDAGVAYADWPSIAGTTVDGTHPDQAFTNALVGQLARAIKKAAPECSAS